MTSKVISMHLKNQSLNKEDVDLLAEPLVLKRMKPNLSLPKHSLDLSVNRQFDSKKGANVLESLKAGLFD